MLLLVLFICLFLFVFVSIILPHTISLVMDIQSGNTNNHDSLFSRFDNDKVSTETAVAMIIGYVVLTVALIGCFTWLTIISNKPYKQTEEMQSKKVNIEYKLSYYDKLFFDYVDEAKQYNKEVNRTNNKKIRFKVEDLTEYMINIDYYIAEFYNNKTTTS